MSSARMTDPNPGERRFESTFVTMTVGGQMCGIPVLSVRDVIETQAMTRVPLAPSEVAGSLNLRGRIVTAIDLRSRLDLPPRDATQVRMSVVIERQGELYSLMVDSVQEVVNFNGQRLDPNPSTLPAKWRELSIGIYQLNSELLIVLDTERVLTFS